MTRSSACLQPGQYQQTLKTSFTVGGLGLHSGEYGESSADGVCVLYCWRQDCDGTWRALFCCAAYVRVRPAYAGEGRYFVRVPEGESGCYAHSYCHQSDSASHPCVSACSTAGEASIPAAGTNDDRFEIAGPVKETDLEDVGVPEREPDSRCRYPLLLHCGSTTTLA